MDRAMVSAASAPLAGADLGGLVWTLVRTDFKTRYHGTLGGFAWALLKPLAMFVVLWAVFSLAFAANPNYKLELIVGLFLWDFFAESTRAGIGSLQAKGFLLTKARFPSWIIVVSSASNAVITLAVFGVVLLAFLTVAGHAPSAVGVALFAWYVVQAFGIVTGISLATSVLFLRYRDLNQVWDLVVQAGFFVAPIIYPLAILPERMHAWLYLWPPTPIVQFSRAVLLDAHPPTLRAHVAFALMTALTLGVGIAVFRRYAPRAAEYL
jgi:homopolymeric O-antigen transport system permease protein